MFQCVCGPVIDSNLLQQVAVTNPVPEDDLIHPKETGLKKLEEAVRRVYL